MTALPATPRRPTIQDVAALIGVLAVLEGEVLAAVTDRDELPDWAEHLTRRLTKDGLLQRGAGSPDLCQALGDLNQRLRYVLGEHDEPDRVS